MFRGTFVVIFTGRAIGGVRRCLRHGARSVLEGKVKLSGLSRNRRGTKLGKNEVVTSA